MLARLLAGTGVKERSLTTVFVGVVLLNVDADVDATVLVLVLLPFTGDVRVISISSIQYN